MGHLPILGQGEDRTLPKNQRDVVKETVRAMMELFKQQ
jgi:hypothetical protein